MAGLLDRVTRARVTILGATGSVGRSTLDLIGRDRDALRDRRADRAPATSPASPSWRGASAPRRAVIGDAALLGDAARRRSPAPASRPRRARARSIEAAASGADWTMAAIVGTAGLKPVMRALEGGGTVALANKEALVSAGQLMIEAAAASGATLLPVDSEHNAIFQCFDRARPESVRRIILTASGGPFRDLADRADARRHARARRSPIPIGRWAPRSRSIARP